MKPEAFAGREPRLVVEEFFSGPSKAWGMFQDRFGNLRRQFEIDANGTWDGETLTLTEVFTFDDGERDQRIWRIRKLGPHDYKGTAEGVLGSAEGAVHGNALHWRYWFSLEVGSRSWKVHFDDWLFLLDKDLLINRARVSKFGLRIGEVTCVFRKIPAGQDRQEPRAEDLSEEIAYLSPAVPGQKRQ